MASICQAAEAKGKNAEERKQTPGVKLFGDGDSCVTLLSLSHQGKGATI